jgi:transcriptional regulator with XRE-family HTH domain
MKAAERLASNIRRLRVARRLSQESLAVDADIAPSFISQMENGRRNPSIEVVERLAKALDVDLVDLLKKPRKNSMPPATLPAGRKRK